MHYTASRAGLGRGLLVLGFALLFLALVVLPVAIVRLHGVSDYAAPLFRLIYTVAFVNLVVFGTLGWLMWLGYIWARWVCAFFLFVAAFLSLTYLAEVRGAAMLALLGKVALDLATAAFIAFSGPIGDYMAERERARKINL